MDTVEHEHELISRAVAGDGAALKLLLLDAHPRLCGYVSRRIPADLRSTLDAEDVAQEAYGQVFRRIGQFQPRGADSFQRWVLTIGLHKLRHAIQPAGGIWVITAKRGRTSASATAHLNQDKLIPLGLAAGLVDNKICSISNNQSAMRFVIRKADRTDEG